MKRGPPARIGLPPAHLRISAIYLHSILVIVMVVAYAVATNVVPYEGSDECSIYPTQISPDIKMIGEGSFPHWSASTGLITFTDKVEDQYEVFVMKPDGSERRCLTFNRSELSECGNRGQSNWHPSGKWIVFSAENGSLQRIGYGASARPGFGRNFNLWIMTADGEEFWKVTSYPENWAVIEAKFSNDGRKIFWNEEYSMEKYPNGKIGDILMPWSRPKGPPYGHPGAYFTSEQFEYRRGEEMLCWRIVYADISFVDSGPIVSNIRRINPPENFTLNEANGFTPDGNGFVGCYSDLLANIGMARWGEIYTCDLDGRLTQRLTETVWRHDEDPCYSPDGEWIAYKETSGYPGQGDEIFIMRSDGSDKRQVTHFSRRGSPEYDPLSEMDSFRREWGSSGTRVTEICFSPDGNSLVFGRCQGETHMLGDALKGDLESLETLTDIPSFIYLLDLALPPA